MSIKWQLLLSETTQYHFKPESHHEVDFVKILLVRNGNYKYESANMIEITQHSCIRGKMSSANNLAENRYQRIESAPSLSKILSGST